MLKRRIDDLIGWMLIDCMQALHVVAPQMIFNVLVLSLITKWYVAPKLASLPRERALVPMLFIHLVRPISMWTLVPGVIVASDMPLAWSRSTAIGDLTAAALAFACIFALRRRASFAIRLVWVFNVLGLLDVLKNAAMAARMDVLPHMGAAALIPAYGVPFLLVSHGVVFWLLLRAPELKTA